MTGVQLIKTYCLPTLMCGCEVWSLTNSSLYAMSGIIVSDEFLHCALAAAQCILIGPVCGWVGVCGGLLPR